MGYIHAYAAVYSQIVSSDRSNYRSI